MTAEQIVRTLAEAQPPLDNEFGDCTLCDALCNEHIRDALGHDADCPWRLAIEWVANHPSS